MAEANYYVQVEELEASFFKRSILALLLGLSGLTLFVYSYFMAPNEALPSLTPFVSIIALISSLIYFSWTNSYFGKLRKELLERKIAAGKTLGREIGFIPFSSNEKSKYPIVREVQPLNHMLSDKATEILRLQILELSLQKSIKENGSTAQRKKDLDRTVSLLEKATSRFNELVKTAEFLDFTVTKVSNPEIKDYIVR